MTEQQPERLVAATTGVAGMEGMQQPQAASGPGKVAWHISTHSPDNGGSCVEAGPVGDGSGRVAVRHSHHPDGAVIVYTREEWAAFLGGVKDGEFDFSG
jgi:hypothetical protein